MLTVHDAAVSILTRHPAPALPLDHVREFIRREGPGGRAPTHLEAARPGSSGPLRVLGPTRRRWAGPGPRRWVLALGRGGRMPSRSLPGRMRESVRVIGLHVEPASMCALARWERVVREEGRVRESLSRKQAERGPLLG